MKLINAGIIGLGVGERHVAALNAHPACRVVALCDWNIEKLYSVGVRYPHMRLTDSADKILSANDIDIVSIASWDDHHATQIVQALRSGKHVFAEKPLCMNYTELRAIREELCAHPNVKLGCNLILRRCPRFLELRRRIRAGEMGRIFSIEADYDYGRMHKIIDGWRGKIDNYSVFLGGGVHMVDLLLWLVGERVIEVVAWGNQIATEGTSFRYDDYVVAMLRFENGTLGKVSANFGCVRPHFHRLSVYGTAATFENTTSCGLFYTSREASSKPLRLEETYPGADKGELVYSFVDALYRGCSHEVPVEDVFSAMSVCLAVEDSLRKACSVRVQYL